MAVKNFTDVVADNHDAESVELTTDELKEKGVTIQGFGLTPGQAVYIPTLAEGRKTFKRAIRKGGEKNVPVVVAIVAEKTGDKYKLTRKGIEVGISSLFNLDADNKPHENDDTCKAVAHLSNHSERLDALGGKVILAGNEVMIKVPRTERSTDAQGNLHINRIYNDEGKLQVREKRITPSRILANTEWAE